MWKEKEYGNSWDSIHILEDKMQWSKIPKMVIIGEKNRKDWSKRPSVKTVADPGGQKRNHGEGIT